MKPSTAEWGPRVSGSAGARLASVGGRSVPANPELLPRLDPRHGEAPSGPGPGPGPRAGRVPPSRERGPALCGRAGGRSPGTAGTTGTRPSPDVPARPLTPGSSAPRGTAPPQPRHSQVFGGCLRASLARPGPRRRSRACVPRAPAHSRDSGPRVSRDLRSWAWPARCKLNQGPELGAQHCSDPGVGSGGRFASPSSPSQMHLSLTCAAPL